MRVLVTSFALALLLSCTSKPQRQEVRAATAGSTSEIARPTLTQQKMCAEQAKKAFDEDQQQTRKLGGDRNVRYDLGGYYSDLTKRRVRNIGHADERIWEKKVGRLQAAAYLRRGAIPPLTLSFL